MTTVADVTTDVTPEAAPTGGLARTAARGARTTVIGQVARVTLQMVGLVALARLLTPQAYGYVAMATAVVGLGELVRDFGLSTAAIQARSLSAGQRANLHWINIGLGLLTGAVVYLSAPAVAAFYGESEVEDITRALAVVFVLSGASTQLRAELSRSMRFGRIAVIDLVAQAGTLLVALPMALAGYGYWSLVVGEVAKSTLVLVATLALVRGWPGRPRRGEPVGHLVRYGAAVAGSQVLTYLGRTTDTLVVGSRLGAAPLGLYNRAFQLLVLPLNQIGAPASRVSIPVLSRLQDDVDTYLAFLHRGHLIVVHAITAVLALALALADPLVRVFLGEPWGDVVPVFQVLAVAGMFQAASYSSRWAFQTSGRTVTELRVTVLCTVVLAGAVVVGSTWGLLGVATGYALAQAFAWLLSLWRAARTVGFAMGSMLGTSLRAFAGYGVAGCVAALLVHGLPLGDVLALVVGPCAFAVTVAAACLLMSSFRQDLRAVMASKQFLR